MNNLISKKIKWILLLCVLLGGTSFFFFQSDDIQYLKKKTIYLLSLVGPLPSSTDLLLLRRQQEISKYIHVAVQFKISVFQHKFEDSSLTKLRAFLTDYFKYPNKNKWTWKNPNKEDFIINIISQEETSKTDLKTTEFETDNEAATSEKEHLYSLFTEKVIKVAKMEFPI